MASSYLSGFLSRPNLQVNLVRYGHQMSTKNRCTRNKPKFRGIKTQENENVHLGQFLVTQRIIRIHPGMNVGMKVDKTLYALCPGKIKFTSEKFDPNFDNPIVVSQYAGREAQTIWKKYINIIPDEAHQRFRLIDVI